MDKELVRQALDNHYQQKRQKRTPSRFWLPLLILIGLGLVIGWPVVKEKQPLQAASVIVPRLETQDAVAFAQIRGVGLKLYLPAPKSKIYGIGYHQAYNPQALALDSLEPLVDTAGREVAIGTSLGTPKAFVMANRGRASLANSSVDVAVIDRTVLKSPVTGRVLAVVPYLLYGKYEDVRVDILPKGAQNIKVALTHVDKIMIKVGDKVIAGKTAVGQPRRLIFNSQIDKYVGQPVAHIHIQVNPMANGATAR